MLESSPTSTGLIVYQLSPNSNFELTPDENTSPFISKYNFLSLKEEFITVSLSDNTQSLLQKASTLLTSIGSTQLLTICKLSATIVSPNESIAISNEVGTVTDITTVSIVPTTNTLEFGIISGISDQPENTQSNGIIGGSCLITSTVPVSTNSGSP